MIGLDPTQTRICPDLIPGLVILNSQVHQGNHRAALHNAGDNAAPSRLIEQDNQLALASQIDRIPMTALRPGLHRQPDGGC